MATDIDVQYFSHLNGLTLSDNWGDLIRMLDKALVTGIDFTSITAASIDAQGDVHITLYAAHNAMLFQVVELTGFAPASLNQKYRIKGVPSTTELILKPHTVIAETSITTVGAGKLASLGYEIIFRDTNDVKRVYRAKNPNAQHPFIRVDESLTSPDGTTGVYTSTYAKYAMVGLLEHMEHIDDYENPDVLQLPFDPSNPSKNWKITGTDSSVIRGWSRWYWAMSDLLVNNPSDMNSPATGSRSFTLSGSKDSFYLLNSVDKNLQFKDLKGCGLYHSSMDTSVIPNWFLMSVLVESNASSTARGSETGSPFGLGETRSRFIAPNYLPNTRLSNSVLATPVVPDFESGGNNKTLFTASNVPALEIPFYDTNRFLRGTLPVVCYAGKKASSNTFTTPILADASMYLWESVTSNYGGGIYFYLGELE
ncbi:hypothetical protein EJJ36_05230 [Acinetobacter junii]|uniref:hypothetical protein n=1 Tax=Acinetobacter junii TaxID=40215 RepID=UPI000F7E009D|nr:hypothetical protein [Acinetobacter junii]RTE46579.1 hypothetical protein EJJ36_05230 [Acinetobacter junii]